MQIVLHLLARLIKTMFRAILFRSTFLLVLSAWFAQGAPLSLHPRNPHYFNFQGRPTVLITSGEHYGALVNLDFDYVQYFDTLAADGLNLTRTFLAYREQPGAFNIAGNSLAPKQDRFITPWARSSVTGYFDGGNKFDLTQWNPKYFERLHDFVRQAAKRRIVVEANLFSCFYSESSWNTHPFNLRNNINGVGSGPWDQILTLRDAELTKHQDAYVRKVMNELREFDNVYYEICNEPYIGGVTREWQDHIVKVITETQRNWKRKFLISENVANGSAAVVNPNPAISIFNFHYATPPSAVGLNYSLDKVIGDNETGFRGTNDAVYRMEGWDFLMAGGGLYNNLDYSFIAGHEDGTFAYPQTQPGGGTVALRKQLGLLHSFFRKFDFLHSKPIDDLVAAPLFSSHSVRGLGTLSGKYVIYLRQSTPPSYSVRWSGTMEVPTTGAYTLHTVSNDGVRLWLDEKKLIDNWTDHGETEDVANIQLEAKRKYPLKLEYFYTGGQSIIKLLWKNSDGVKVPVPESAFGNGLKADYFLGRDLTTPWKSRVDSQIFFAWGTDFPFPQSNSGALNQLVLNLPPGAYKSEFTEPATGRVLKKTTSRTVANRLTLELPTFHEDLAIRLTRQ